MRTGQHCVSLREWVECHALCLGQYFPVMQHSNQSTESADGAVVCELWIV